jgi:riboflavin synthase
MTEDYYERQLDIERAATRMVVEQLLNHMILEVHEHRDQMKENNQFHEEEKERLCDHIEDLRCYIKKLEEQVVDAGGVVETTGQPYLDIGEIKPIRVVAYR